MIISPASGKQIVSMYKAVYDENGNPIGLVGLGIYTDRLINNLNALKIKGIDEAFYSMINVKDGKYVFNKDSSLVGTVAKNRDLQKLCEKFSGKTTADDGYFEYNESGTDYISTYSYMPEYGWILTIDDTKSEVYSLTKVMRIYMAIFGVAILALMLIFSFINKRQEKVNQKLASTIVKNNKTKESLYTAMFKDVLTDVNNRISFSMDLEETKSSPNEPYYFIMFNINEFSEVNTKYGNDTGDWLLVRTVDILRQIFKKGKIYRTGSDEFVVALQVNDHETSSAVIIEDAGDAHRRLSANQNTPMGKLKFGFRASVVKKSGNINTSVVTVLKDIINKENNAVAGKIGYIDMDQM
jgi:diguanylate cyclase (GGDEF)-like protein